MSATGVALRRRKVAGVRLVLAAACAIFVGNCNSGTLAAAAAPGQAELAAGQALPAGPAHPAAEFLTSPSRGVGGDLLGQVKVGWGKIQETQARLAEDLPVF
jgi:hypothetical protein